MTSLFAFTFGRKRNRSNNIPGKYSTLKAIIKSIFCQYKNEIVKIIFCIHLAAFSGAHYTREIGSFGKNDDLLAFLQLGEERFERS